MNYIFPPSYSGSLMVSSNKEANRENLDSSHEEGVPLFLQFPSPFLDDISTTAMLPNHHQHDLSNDRCKSAAVSSPDGHLNVIAETPPSPSKTKRTRKKRGAGKKDRHSKIYTAQGLRDRRMRLSLHVARKFFGLQDMLGFDKASKTIEWLFCKSKKAIEEVTENLKSQNTTQSISRENIEKPESPLSDCEVDSGMEFNTASIKGRHLKLQDDIKDCGNSRKPIERYLLARESRNKARARARERTQERMMCNHLEKLKQMIGANPNDDFGQIQVGFLANPNNHYIEESSSSPLESSSTHHLLDLPRLDNMLTKPEDYLGNTSSSSSTYYSAFDCKKNFANPPAGWLNSSNTFLGFLGDFDYENFRMESENYGVMPNGLTGDIHGQIPSSIVVPHYNHVHFQTKKPRN